jgi:hypothetical protein
MQLTGNVTVSALSIQVVGNYTQTGNVTVSPVITGAAAAANPFVSMPMPTFSACTFTKYKQSGNGNLSLTPGTYCGGIEIGGNHSVNFSPGLYVLYGGGIRFTGNIAPILGTGVTFYNTGNGSTYPYAGLDLSGNVALNLSAPLTGTYAGMLIMQDPLNIKASTLVGNAGASLAGNLYFPNSALNLNGNSGTEIPMGSVVAKSIGITGNTRFSMTNTYGGAAGTVQRIGLYQ